MSKTIAVAILNWNGADLLKRFLPSVLKYSTESVIYVIDNASEDNSLEVLQSEFPEVKTITISDNLGYAGGYNAGLKNIEEEFIVLLNSDVEVTENWLAPLYKRFEDDEKLAAIQPKIKDLNQQDHFEYAGASGGFIDYLGYPFCRGRLFYKLEEDQKQYEDFKEVFWATGACLMVRKSAFIEAKGFNEKLFAHMEEIDLCWRMHNYGYKVACEPKSTVYHLGGGTLNKLSPRKTFLNFRNSLIILLLNLPEKEAIKKILFRLILDGIAGAKFLLEGRPKHMVAVIKAHFSFYSMYIQLTKDRAHIPQRSMKLLPGVYQNSLVWDFFKNKRQHFSDLETDKISNY
jgi:GT2 family glycosyltransferase